jgi:phage antirepressor YoqD-like protein
MPGPKTKLTVELMVRAREFLDTTQSTTIREFAKRLGVNHTQLYRWKEKGQWDIAEGNDTIFAAFTMMLYDEFYPKQKKRRPKKGTTPIMVTTMESKPKTWWEKEGLTSDPAEWKDLR